MNTKHLTCSQKLSRAKTQLLLNQPFFGTLCVRLKLVPDPEFPTMATDGHRIVYNPGFVEQLSPAELEGVLAHEVLHCALTHQCRRGHRAPGLWNEACDYAVNPILLDNGITLPAGILIDAAFRDLSAEEIYARLARSREQEPSPSENGSDGCGKSTGDPIAPAGNETDLSNAPSHAARKESPQLGTRPGGFGEVLDAGSEDVTPVSQAETNRQAHEWSIAADQAMHSAKACGRIPAGIDRQLAQTRESRQDWRSILRDFISATDPSDYSWTPPNRRFIGSGLYLPSVIRAGVGEIVIVVDTSGSIGSDEIQQFAGEITAISAEARPERIHVVYVDAAVQETQEFEPGEDVVLAPKGGGGTDFRPAIEWVNEQGLTPKCLLYLTDLCCHSYPAEPDYPVLWVTGSRRIAPFGETLRIQTET